MQMATQVNEAYRTLKSPVLRAKYLLELNGVDVGFETNTAMPPDFLMQQMEWREALEDARDAAALGKLEQRLAEEKRMIEAHIARSIDAEGDYAGAAGPVRKLMFLERFGEDIAGAHERLDA
jgi:molecular chaperone HscB